LTAPSRERGPVALRVTPAGVSLGGSF
jgi:hypothetical protein